MQTARKTKQPLDPLSVVTHPEDYSDCPIVMADAWGALKQARGQPVDYSKTGPMAYRIDRPEPDPGPEDIRLRCSGKAVRIAQAKGFYDDAGNAA